MARDWAPSGATCAVRCRAHTAITLCCRMRLPPARPSQGVSGTGQGFDAASVGRLGQYSFIPTHNPPEYKKRDAVLKVGSRGISTAGKLTS
jgi:hypothetical protein